MACYMWHWCSSCCCCCCCHFYFYTMNHAMFVYGIWCDVLNSKCSINKRTDISIKSILFRYWVFYLMWFLLAVFLSLIYTDTNTHIKIVCKSFRLQDHPNEKAHCFTHVQTPRRPLNSFVSNYIESFHNASYSTSTVKQQ